MPRGGTSIALSAPRPGREFDRLAWVIVLAAALAVLWLARGLTPDGRGTGTHTQLGLAPCALLSTTGLPCPACGLTTSFAHMAHLEPIAAMRANAGGVVGFALVFASALVAPLALWRRWGVDDVLRHAQVDRVAIALGVLLLVQWLLRLWVMQLAWAGGKL